jgi:hypothetical protein
VVVAFFEVKSAPALRKPMRGTGLKIFIHPAVMVTVSSHERGRSGTHLEKKPPSPDE